jgi:hypothetical protein
MLIDWDKRKDWPLPQSCGRVPEGLLLAELGSGRVSDFKKLRSNDAA